MKTLLILKWVLCLALLAVFCVAAGPLFFCLMLINGQETRDYSDFMGKYLAHTCREDFRRLQIKQQGAIR